MNTILRESPTLASIPVSYHGSRRWIIAAVVVLITSFVLPTYLVQLESAEHLHQCRARELSLKPQGWSLVLLMMLPQQLGPSFLHAVF
jgi:hypothetical protein